MSTPIENNTTELQAILDTVNSLPSASGGSNETCQVTINFPVKSGYIVTDSISWDMYVSPITDPIKSGSGPINMKLIMSYASKLVAVVPKGTVICCYSSSNFTATECDDGIIPYAAYSGSTEQSSYLKTIVLVVNSSGDATIT